MSKTPHLRLSGLADCKFASLPYRFLPLLLLASTFSPAAISFVQQNYAVPQTPQSSVSVTYTAAQAAGDTNVVAIGWSDSTSSVTSVTDTRGNVYTAPIAPTRQAGVQSVAVYVARNVVTAAANANTVTIIFSAAVPYADVRILAYRGLDTVSPVEAAVGASGTGSSSNSGSLTTTNANDLLFAANCVSSLTTAAGSGFTSRVITSPDGDIAEDRVVTAAGTYSAAATMSSGKWVMQLVALKAAGALPAAATPTFSPDPGTYTSTQAVRLADTTSGATIYYTLDGSTPTTSSTVYNDATPIQVTVAATIKAMAAASGFTNSAVATGAYTIQVAAAATPTFIPTPGNYTSAQSVRLQDATPGATIFYTLNGSTPTTASAVYNDASPIQVSTTTTIKAIAAASGFANSAVASGAYTIQQAIAATPTFTPAPGNYTSAQTVRLQDATPGATIYYTLNGSTPTTASTVYNDATPIQVTATTTIQAIAAAGGFANSAVATGAYTIQPATAATPTFTPAPGTYTSAQTVRLQDSTSGATIYYTLNGSTPTTSSSVYNDASPIIVASTTTIKAMAGAAGFANSAVTTGTYVIGTLGPIAYVQSNSAVPQSPQSSVSVTYTAAQTAGNMNLVVVGYSEVVSSVISVTDTKGNLYKLAVGPTMLGSAETLSIYYAANIGAAGANGNVVTVAFTIPTRYPDIRIAEYSGINPTNPLDVTAAGQGSGTAASSGAVTTTNANDLLVGASQVQNRTTAAGSGFTKRLITSPNGDILEDRVVSAIGSYSATAAIASSGWVMQMAAFRGGTGGGSGPDIIPPSVSVTSPAGGSTVSGSINISAGASDNTAVSGVQFQIDGVNVGPVATASPYLTSFNTAQFANGTHLISAYAWDPARNIGKSSSVSVTFSNSGAGNPAQNGLWSGTISWPLVGLHASVLATGRVLMWDQMAIGLKDPVLWDPVTSAFTSVPMNDSSNIFCSGFVLMADGRLLNAGGHVTADVGLPIAHIFNPSTSTWTSLPNMSFARWYPTATTLPDGRILVTAGEINCRSCNAVIPEIYDPATNQWTLLSVATMDTLYYPHMYVLPDGRLLAAGSSEAPVPTRVLNVQTQTWADVDTRLLEGGSSAMYLPGKVVKNGTSRLPDLTTPQASSALTYVLDMSQPSPAWRQVASMAYPRAYHNMTILPDGDVLVTGGGTTSDPIGLSGSVLPAELWSPLTETWKTLSSMHTGRLYHSIAALLPDARVLIAGGGRFFGSVDPTDQPSAEIFSPPYLFKGPRPAITSAPSTLQYGQSFTVQSPDSARIAKVSLIRLSAVTHAFNQNQRFQSLSFVQNTGSLSVTAPANANLAPPGDYMLFLVDTNGVPSVASMVRF